MSKGKNVQVKRLARRLGVSYYAARMIKELQELTADNLKRAKRVEARAAALGKNRPN